MKIHEIIYGLDGIEDAAQEIYDILPLVSVVTFSGGLGAGKTTLIQALLHHCGIEGVIQSPTFTYVTTYSNLNDQMFFHFDLYRLKTMQDFIEAGFEEYLYQPNSWSFIEWPEIIRPLLKDRICDLVIENIGEDKRRIRYVIKG